jgi:hypothetical protein
MKWALIVWTLALAQGKEPVPQDAQIYDTEQQCKAAVHYSIHAYDASRRCLPIDIATGKIVRQ